MRDINSEVAGWLRDLAFVQKSPHSRWGYKRAASAVMYLPVPIDTLVNPTARSKNSQHADQTARMLGAVQTPGVRWPLSRLLDERSIGRSLRDNPFKSCSRAHAALRNRLMMMASGRLGHLGELSHMRYVTGLVILIAASMACSRGNDRAVVQSPTGPTAVAETTIAYIGGVSGPMDVLFPGRNESFMFRNDLETKYATGLGRAAAGTSVDAKAKSCGCRSTSATASTAAITPPRCLA